MLTKWLGSGNRLTRLVTAMFANGEQGGAYDPSDPVTLFQDSAGTTPVTAATQPVGLILDKRLGLARGSELLTNGDFGTGLVTPWVVSTSFAATAAVVAGELQVTSSAGFGRYVQPITCVIGQWYAVTVSMRLISGVGNCQLSVSSFTSGASSVAAVSGGGVVGPSLPYTCFFQATAVTHYIGVGEASANFGTVTGFDNISVKSLAGNHLIQATAAARPTWQQDASGLYYLNFDGVDDSLVTAGNVDFSATQIATMWLGVQKNAEGPGFLLALGNAGTAGQLNIFANSGWQYRMYGATGQDSIQQSELGVLARVLSCVFKNDADRGAALNVLPRSNGAVPTTTIANDTGTQPQAMANASIILGGTPGQFSTSRIYGAIVLGRQATANEISSVENAIGSKMAINL